MIGLDSESQVHNGLSLNRVSHLSFLDRDDEGAARRIYFVR